MAARDKNLFIVWSGSLSQKIAREFFNWIPDIIQSVDPFFSEDTDKGKFWQGDVNRNLARITTGIVILTPENLNSGWIHYEAGALSNKLTQKERVCPILINLKKSDVNLPLNMLQLTYFNKDEIFKMIKSINDVQTQPLESERLLKYFNDKWDNFKEVVEKHVKDQPKEKKVELPKRDSNEMLEEIIAKLRNIEGNELPDLRRGLQELVPQIPHVDFFKLKEFEMYVIVPNLIDDDLNFVRTFINNENYSSDISIIPSKGNDLALRFTDEPVFLIFAKSLDSRKIKYITLPI